MKTPQSFTDGSSTASPAPRPQGTEELDHANHTHHANQAAHTQQAENTLGRVNSAKQNAKLEIEPYKMVQAGAHDCIGWECDSPCLSPIRSSIHWPSVLYVYVSSTVIDGSIYIKVLCV